MQLKHLMCDFDNIIFDLDSTLVTIEGIDELARLKNVEDLIVPLTQSAMNGEISLELAFKKRLEIINPSYEELRSLAHLYTQHFVPGVQELIAWLQKQGKSVFIVSGGYDPAVTEVAELLGIPNTHVFANRLLFNIDGKYIGLKESDFLWKVDGKKKIVAEIKSFYPGKTVLIGDGISDWEAAEILERFICYAGVAQRKKVIDKVDYVIYEPDIRAVATYLA